MYLINKRTTKQKQNKPSFHKLNQLGEKRRKFGIMRILIIQYHFREGKAFYLGELLIYFGTSLISLFRVFSYGK